MVAQSPTYDVLFSGQGRFSTFDMFARNVHDYQSFDILMFRSEEIGNPHRVTWVRNSMSSVILKNSYRTADPYATTFRNTKIFGDKRLSCDATCCDPETMG